MFNVGLALRFSVEYSEDLGLGGTQRGLVIVHHRNGDVQVRLSAWWLLDLLVIHPIEVRQGGAVVGSFCGRGCFVSSVLLDGE